jgi:hypothetical protein
MIVSSCSDMIDGQFTTRVFSRSADSRRADELPSVVSRVPGS